MDKQKQYSPIGVFDSGVGGISVLKVLCDVIPSENYIYFGDSANAPYGGRSVDEVREKATEVTEFLLSKGAKAIVIACNTATSAAASFLREKYSRIPIIGMEPAIKPAAFSGEYPSVLVMATELTLEEDKFLNLLSKYKEKADFTCLPCPSLVEYVEKGIICGDEMEKELHRLLDPYIMKKQFDSVVLGCTHFIHLGESVKKVAGKKIKLFDGALGTAKETLNKLKGKGLLNPSEVQGKVEFYNSSETDEMIRISHMLFGK